MKRNRELVAPFDRICDELRDYCWPETYLEVASEVVKWRESREPHHIDRATAICCSAGVPVTSSLQAEIKRAARHRPTNTPPGMPEDIDKQGVLSWALLLIANLHHAGLPLDQAARKVAPLTDGSYDAATLERYFGPRMRESYETQLQPHWEALMPNHKEVWLEFANSLPDAVE